MRDELWRSDRNPNVAFAIELKGRLMRTSDAGATWSAVTGLAGRAVSWIAMAPGDNSIVYASFLRTVLFVNKHSAETGEHLFRATSGGFGTIHPRRVRADAKGWIYLAEDTVAIDSPPEAPARDGALYDAFVMAFDPHSGAEPVYSRRFAGVGQTYLGGMAVDCMGNVALALTSDTEDLEVTPDALAPRNAGAEDGVLEGSAGRSSSLLVLLRRGLFGNCEGCLHRPRRPDSSLGNHCLAGASRTGSNTGLSALLERAWRPASWL
jgi:hypothetical protein